MNLEKNNLKRFLQRILQDIMKKQDQRCMLQIHDTKALPWYNFEKQEYNIKCTLLQGHT